MWQSTNFYGLLLFMFSWIQLAELSISYSLIGGRLVEREYKDWDYMIFTQHWPPTVCVDWENKKPDHSCSMPETPDSWTIHGLWPTTPGTFGPEYCNKTWLFDPEEVRPIEKLLEQYWTNIEAGTGEYNLWAHEWNKHGTCAAEIEPFNTQFKYFSKGIEWIQQLSMSKILTESNIVPSDDKLYTIEDFHNGVVSQLKVDPQIECQFEKGGKQYIFEIRLCFNKALEPVNCSVVKPFGLAASTNCLPSRGITYPATYNPPKRYLINLYKLANFLQWFTL